MRTSEVISKIDIPRHKLYYLEQKGYINPDRFSMGEIEVREYDDKDVRKIEVIWRYLKLGFKHKIAYQKAMDELDNQQLSIGDIIK